MYYSLEERVKNEYIDRYAWWRMETHKSTQSCIIFHTKKRGIYISSVMSSAKKSCEYLNYICLAINHLKNSANRLW